MSKTIQWLSPAPITCEMCGSLIRNVFYDAKTKQGPWACMCPRCHTEGQGVGKLGRGYGQEYTKQGTAWIKTGG